MTDHPYGPFVSAETVEPVMRPFDDRPTDAELRWLSDSRNLAKLLRWTHEHDLEEFLLGDSPGEDGGLVEVTAPSGLDNILDFLEEPYGWLGELRAMQMSEALREEREHIPL